jgi:hypothetical protein
MSALQTKNVKKQEIFFCHFELKTADNVAS